MNFGLGPSVKFYLPIIDGVCNKKWGATQFHKNRQTSLKICVSHVKKVTDFFTITFTIIIIIEM